MSAPDAPALFDFSREDVVRAWRAIDDVVMGGVSRSRLTPGGEGQAVFAGELSFERGGGFASVRSPERALDLGGYDGLELEARGDGRTYRLRVRTPDLRPDASYVAAFVAAPDWERVRIPFGAFEPRLRGRPVPGAPPLDRRRITSLGLLLLGGEPGAFRLELRAIRALRAAPG